MGLLIALLMPRGLFRKHISTKTLLYEKIACIHLPCRSRNLNIELVCQFFSPDQIYLTLKNLNIRGNEGSHHNSD